MVRPTSFRRLALTLLTAAVAAAGFVAALPAQPGPRAPQQDTPPAPPTDFVRYSRHVPGDAKPVVIDADRVTAWTAGDTVVLLLRGQVLVQQDVLQTRFAEGVAFIDLKHYRETGIWQVQVYAEGDVQIDTSAELRKGSRGFLDLSTRGEFKFNAVKGKVEQKDRSDDPLYKRGVQQRTGPRSDKGPSATDPKVKQASLQEKGTSVPSPLPPVRPAQFVQPGPVTPPPGPITAPRPSPTNPPGASPTPAPAIPAPAPPPPGTPVLPPLPAPGPPIAPVPARTPSPPTPTNAPERQYSIAPRTRAGYNIDTIPLPGGEQAIVFTGGIILAVRNVENIGLLDIEADQLVVWTKGNSAQQLLNSIRAPEGQRSRDLEFYLSGNVEIRQQDTSAPRKKPATTNNAASGVDPRSGDQPRAAADNAPTPLAPDAAQTTAGPMRILRASEVYYDVSRNVALALGAELEFFTTQLPESVRVKADELQQLGLNQYRVLRGEIFSSKLPADPGLKIVVSEATIEDVTVPRYSIFGRRFVDPKTGQAQDERQTIVTSRDVFLELADVPVFYLPYVRANARNPLGPIEGANFGFNRIFGAQIGLTLDAYELFGMDPLEGTRWRIYTDYLSKRGPGLGTDFDYGGVGVFGGPGRYEGLLKAYGMYDDGKDILGGGRGENDNHPLWRGRVLYRQQLAELADGFTVQSQVSALSDQNFLEQYYKNEFDTDLNQRTYLHVKQQLGNLAWTLHTEPRLLSWVTVPEWYPAANAHLIGQPVFGDLLTYDAWLGLGYANLEIGNLQPPVPVVSPTDMATSTGRFHLGQELAAPFSLGAFRLTPYATADLQYYTEDLQGESLARAWGGGGLRASLPLSRLYPDVQSELFNLNGINHKIVFGANYLYAQSTSPYSQLPQLDRINDDPTDQALRQIRPQLPTLNPANGLVLATSPLYDPQVFALRRAVLNRIDTLSALQVAQLDVRQRWQTKRGFPGNQHVIDWMTLDLSASVYPQPDRDNFGNVLAFLEYDYVWNVGDRTALVSSGWVDPIDDGARVFTVGAFLNRPDRTNFYLGFRSIEPVSSQALTGAVTYIFSPKYAVTASSTYDFGTSQALSNQLTFTRMGADVQVSLGINYNALQNNFGVTFEILPNLVGSALRRGSGVGSFAPTGLLNN